MQGLRNNFGLFLGPWKVEVRQPLLILAAVSYVVPFVGGPRESWGYTPIPVSFGPPRRQG